MSRDDSNSDRRSPSISSNGENYRQVARKSTGARQKPISNPVREHLKKKRMPLGRLSQQQSQDPVTRVINKMQARVNKSIARPSKVGVGRGKANISIDALAAVHQRQVLEEQEEQQQEQQTRSHRRKQDNPRRLSGLRNLDVPRCIPRAPFMRLIRDIIRRFESRPLKIQMIVVEVLHEATESYLTQFFERCAWLIAHAKRVTLLPRDMQLAVKLESSNNARGRLAQAQHR